MNDLNDPPELSRLAAELVKLRDWLLTSRSMEGATPERVLDGMDRKLRLMLEREGLAAIDETNLFDRARHEVIETVQTHDPELNDRIAETVRPGYMLGDALFRPQQVIVYDYRPEGRD